MTRTAKHLLLIALLGVVGGAQAQNAKPAPQKIDLNKMMTREELRACMKMQDDIKSTAATLDQRKATLQQDRAQLAPANEGLKTLKAEMDQQLAAAREFDGESAKHAARVQAWNAEWKEAQASTMRSAERQRKELEAERKELDARMKTLQASRDAAINTYKGTADRFNLRIKEVETLTTDWNQRNEKLADDADQLIELRATYAADCARRKFDERDEIAIKKGQ